MNDILKNIQKIAHIDLIYGIRLTATNSSNMVLFNLLSEPSEARRALANAPEYPAEWIASNSKVSGLLAYSLISAFTFWICKTI